MGKELNEHAKRLVKKVKALRPEAIKERRKKLTRLENLNYKAYRCGLAIYTYSPGDGITRYRIGKQNSAYFADDGLYTALGIKEAHTWINGYFAHVRMLEQIEGAIQGQ